MKMCVREALPRVAEAFISVGLERLRAEESARILTVAEVWGLHSHGFLRLPVYLSRLRHGGINPNAELSVLEDRGPIVTYGGEKGLGLWQLSEAADMAIQRAQQYGITLIGVSDSGHGGALGYYMEKIASAGIIGLAASTGPPVIPAWGGSTPLLSTSPLAAGYPTTDGVAIIDMALSTVARGKVAAMGKRGELLPDGWAFDADGHPTNDPQKALVGMLAPLGGAKGFALAFMVEGIAAGLNGPKLSKDQIDFFDIASYDKPQGIGHTIIAIDPKICGVENVEGDYFSRISALVNAVESSGGRIPGSRRARLDEIDGSMEIEVDDTLYEELFS